MNGVERSTIKAECATAIIKMYNARLAFGGIGNSAYNLRSESKVCNAIEGSVPFIMQFVQSGF